MPLSMDPVVVIEGLKRGNYSFNQAKKIIEDLIIEIKDGIWSIEELGFEKPEELWQFLPRKEEEIC